MAGSRWKQYEVPGSGTVELRKCACGMFTQKPLVRFWDRKAEHWEHATLCGKCRKVDEIFEKVAESHVENKQFARLKAQRALDKGTDKAGPADQGGTSTENPVPDDGDGESAGGGGEDAPSGVPEVGPESRSEEGPGVSEERG